MVWHSYRNWSTAAPILFRPATPDFEGVTIGIGLLIRSEERGKFLGQWRYLSKDRDEPLCYTEYGLKRTRVVGKVPQVQFEERTLSHTDDVVPLAGLLEWLTDGKGKIFGARITTVSYLFSESFSYFHLHVISW